MGIPCYLAMTAAEMAGNWQHSAPIAWMGCQFSACGTGLSNLPPALPPGSVLTLNDQMPIHGHDPKRIRSELERCAEQFPCAAVLLDFQRPGNREMEALVSELEKMPFPLVVSQLYAQGLDCGVLLSPVPPSVPLTEHLAPWKGRAIWLELALDGEILSLSEQGAEVTPLPYPDQTVQGFAEETLHCHYRTRLTGNTAEFTLWRTAEDLQELKKEAEQLGIIAVVGLYQELHSFPNAL